MPIAAISARSSGSSRARTDGAEHLPQDALARRARGRSPPRVGDPGRLAVGAEPGRPGCSQSSRSGAGLGRRGAPCPQRPFLGPRGELAAELGLPGVSCLVSLGDLRRGPARHALSERLRLAPGGGRGFFQAAVQHRGDAVRALHRPAGDQVERLGHRPPADLVLTDQLQQRGPLRVAHVPLVLGGGRCAAVRPRRSAARRRATRTPR